MRKSICLLILLSLLFAGCDKSRSEYNLIAEGTVTDIAIIGGSFANPSRKVLHIDDGSVVVFYVNGCNSVKIGDYVYVYYRSWDGKIIRHKPL